MIITIIIIIMIMIIIGCLSLWQDMRFKSQYRWLPCHVFSFGYMLLLFAECDVVRSAAASRRPADVRPRAVHGAGDSAESALIVIILIIVIIVIVIIMMIIIMII